MESFALQKAGAVVQSQQPRGRLADRRRGKDRETQEAEVVTPSIRAWVEKTDELTRFRNDRSNVAPLLSIADEAGIGKVVLTRHPAMFFADDVVDLTAEKRVVLMDETVFTKGVRTRCHEPPQIGSYMTGAHAGYVAERYCRARALARRMMCSSWR